MRTEKTIRKELARLEASPYSQYSREAQNVLIWVLCEGRSLVSGRTKVKETPNEN